MAASVQGSRVTTRCKSAAKEPSPAVGESATVIDGSTDIKDVRESASFKITFQDECHSSILSLIQSNVSSIRSELEKLDNVPANRLLIFFLVA